MNATDTARVKAISQTRSRRRSAASEPAATVVAVRKKKRKRPVKLSPAERDYKDFIDECVADPATIDNVARTERILFAVDKSRDDLTDDLAIREKAIDDQKIAAEAAKQRDKLSALLDGMGIGSKDTFSVLQFAPDRIADAWRNAADPVSFLTPLIAECFNAHKALSEMVRPSGSWSNPPYRTERQKTVAAEQAVLREKYQAAEHRLADAEADLSYGCPNNDVALAIVRAFDVPISSTKLIPQPRPKSDSPTRKPKRAPAYERALHRAFTAADIRNMPPLMLRDLIADLVGCDTLGILRLLNGRNDNGRVD